MTDCPSLHAMDALPIIPARNVLTDMDQTLVGPVAQATGDVLVETLAALVARRRHVPVEKALHLIRARHDPQRECISASLPRFDIEAVDYWNALIPRLSECLRFYDDAARMVRELHARGFVLYPATTNSAFVFLAKLAVGGLAQAMQTPYYRQVLGGAELCPEGKSGAKFFQCLLERFELDPAETVMVGDHPQADLAASRAAGVAYVILVDREQPEDWRGIEGGVSVRSLDMVPRLLRRIQDQGHD